VISAIDQALETHELVKVRVSAETHDPVDELGSRVESATRSSLAQVIGKTILLYRPRKKDPVIVLPKSSEPRSKKAGA
jgi:RNA-binding protein